MVGDVRKIINIFFLFKGCVNKLTTLRTLIAIPRNTNKLICFVQSVTDFGEMEIIKRVLFCFFDWR